MLDIELYKSRLEAQKKADIKWAKHQRKINDILEGKEIEEEQEEEIKVTDCFSAYRARMQAQRKAEIEEAKHIAKIKRILGEL